MTEPKCKTCGQELSLDLNGDYFCLRSVVSCENHDDTYPSPFITIEKKDLKKLYDMIIDGLTGDICWLTYRTIKQKYEKVLNCHDNNIR